MAEPLVPCLSCGRHLRLSETACPFCGAAITDDMSARLIGVPSQRLGRSAVFAFAATLAVTGCGSTVTEVGDAGGTATDASTDAKAATDGGGAVEDGGLHPVYGAPPSQDSGGAMPVYGSPPQRDAGVDSGGSMPIYGAAPPPPDK